MSWAGRRRAAQHHQSHDDDGKRRSQGTCHENSISDCQRRTHTQWAHSVQSLESPSFPPKTYLYLTKEYRREEKNPRRLKTCVCVCVDHWTRLIGLRHPLSPSLLELEPTWELNSLRPENQLTHPPNYTFPGLTLPLIPIHWRKDGRKNIEGCKSCEKIGGKKFTIKISDQEKIDQNCSLIKFFPQIFFQLVAAFQYLCVWL